MNALGRLERNYAALLEEEEARGILPDEADLLAMLDGMPPVSVVPGRGEETADEPTPGD